MLFRENKSRHAGCSGRIKVGTLAAQGGTVERDETTLRLALLCIASPHFNLTRMYSALQHFLYFVVPAGRIKVVLIEAVKRSDETTLKQFGPL